MEIEVWKNIGDSFPEFGKYEVSNHGRVRNYLTRQVLKQKLRNGYLYCSLFNKGKSITFSAHKLVAVVFKSKKILCKRYNRSHKYG